MRDEIFKSLEARWHELYDQYEVVKAALPPIVRWEWTNRSRYDPRPFHYLIDRPRGRVIKPPPEHDRPWQDYYQYGFDESGKVIVEHRYYVYKLMSELFYTYAPDKLEIHSYSQHHDRYLLNTVTLCALEGDLMQQYANLSVYYYSIDPSAPYPSVGQVERYRGQGVKTATAEEAWAQLSQQEHGIGWQYQEYVYQDEQLTRIQNYSRSGLTSENLMEYDAAGGLQKITRLPPLGGDHSLLYRKREPGETRATLAKRVITKLVEAIPQIVAAAKFTEPLYGLSLNYYSDIIYSFPPKILPNFESDRQRAILEYTPNHLRNGLLWVTIWDDEAHPDIPYPPLPINDPQVLESCENFNADMRRGQDYGFMVRTIREIARELNKLDWSKYAPVTSDFIVFACDDTEHTRPSVSLRYSGATEQQLADWRKRGLL